MFRVSVETKDIRKVFTNINMHLYDCLITTGLFKIMVQCNSFHIPQFVIRQLNVTAISM